MTLTELRYIVALAQEKHFGRAAKICFVSQPTLSVGIKKLEDDLGVTIFERDKNDVRMTKIGEQMIEQAQCILEEAEKLKDMATSGKNQLRGTLKIGAIYTVGSYLLPNLIPKLKKLAPEMPLVVEEDLTANLREKLLSGKSAENLKKIAILIEKAHERIIGHGIRGGLKEITVYDLNEKQLINEIKNSIIVWNKLSIDDLKDILYEYYFLNDEQ